MHFDPIEGVRQYEQFVFYVIFNANKAKPLILNAGKHIAFLCISEQIRQMLSW